MENDHECHKLDYGWVWHKLTWATYGGAAMRSVVHKFIHQDIAIDNGE